MSEPRASDIILVRDAYKRYKTKSSLLAALNIKFRDSDEIVFNGLNITVTRGSIYALLGPSGCGKTTLLRCLMGRIYLDDGKIHMGVESLNNIGYMPQELALQPELTIRETISIHAKIAELSYKFVNDRKQELFGILDIPNEDLRIGDLGGGQQRRVSLFIALMHDPELLILDEPTVGQDTQLRRRIWDYIIQLTREKNKTVLITTHYIEEARNSEVVGLMRKGFILEEGPPQSLMDKYNCSSMDMLFTHLCENQSSGMQKPKANPRRAAPLMINLPTSWLNPAPPFYTTGMDFCGSFSLRAYNLHMVLLIKDYPKKSMKERSPLAAKKSFSWSRCNAHVLRDYYWMKQNLMGTFIYLFIPVFQCVLMSYSFGEKPMDLPVGFVNNEIMFNQRNCDSLSKMSCTTSDIGRPFSCYYKEMLEKKGLIIVAYDTDDQAKEAVSKNKIWASVHIPQNFSYNLIERLNMGIEVSDEILEKSSLEVNLDVGVKVISESVKLDLYKAIGETLKHLYEQCNWAVRLASTPIDFKEPVHGTNDTTFKEFVMPSIIITNIYYLPMLYIIVVFVQEKKTGVLERNIVSGMTPAEIILGHSIVAMGNLIIQEGSCMLIMYWVFGSPLEGSVLLAAIILYAVGLNGLTCGFTIAISIESDFAALYSAIGSILPFSYISGMFWPLEGAHKIIQVISKFLPLTFTIEAIRSIGLRGWGIDAPVVYLSLIVTVIYIIINCILSTVLYKRSKLS